MHHTAKNQQAPQARHEDLVIQEMPDEVLVYDLKTHRAHCLNKTAAFVWNHCDGQTSIAEMQESLEQKTGLQVSEDLIWYALHDLSKARLLEKKIYPSSRDWLSRRSMLRSLGFGAVVGIPLIVTITSPQAVSAQSVTVTANRVPDGTCNAGTSGGCLGQCCTSAGGGGRRICCNNGGHPSCPPTGVGCIGAPCTDTSSANCTP